MAGNDDLFSQAQNIARQIGEYARAIVNTNPAPTSTISPFVTGINSLGTTGTTLLVSASTTRHGILFHNPGTASVYVFPSSIATVPTTTSIGGTVVIYGGGTFQMPALQFPNVTDGWSGFTLTGSSQPLTIVEFF